MKLVQQVVTYLILIYKLSNCEIIQDDSNLNSIEITTLPEKLEDEHPVDDENDIKSNIVPIHDDEEKPEVLEYQMKEIRLEREDPHRCYQVDTKEYCFERIRNGSGCECEEVDEGNIACCNVTDIVKSINCLQISNYKNIHVINFMEKEIDLTALNSLKETNSIAITDGNITKVSGSFAKFTKIKCLSFANNKIEDFNDRALLHSTELKTLNLSGNNITKLPSTNAQNITVDVQGNKKISCINISGAIDKGIKFLNKENSSCERETFYTWFNDTASVNVLALEKMKKLSAECPKECKCEPSHMYYRNNTLEVTAKVDCSSQNLANFPSAMPSETVELIVSNNSISSLTTLIQSKNYQNVQRLFIDGNKISSIEELDGTRFFENFTILSLKNNKIKEIPNYILSNLEKNLNSGKVGKIYWLLKIKIKIVF
jgi:Leucine-rich repeat (LRR) protein